MCSNTGQCVEVFWLAYRSSLVAASNNPWDQKSRVLNIKRRYFGGSTGSEFEVCNAQLLNFMLVLCAELLQVSNNNDAGTMCTTFNGL